MRDLFKKYGAQYNLDFLLMAAQGYQESTLDQTARNPSGAIGVMQVLPSTAKDLKVGDITQLEPNIHAGVKYIRFMMDKYYDDDPMDPLNKGLMTFAVVQRRARTDPAAAARSGEARPRSQRLVRQRRAGRLREDRPRDRDTTSATSTSTTSPTSWSSEQMQLRAAAKAKLAPK